MKLRLKTSAAVAALLVAGGTTFAVAQGTGGGSSAEKQAPSAQPGDTKGSGSGSASGSASGQSGQDKSGSQSSQSGSAQGQGAGTGSAPGDTKRSGTTGDTKTERKAGSGDADSTKKSAEPKSGQGKDDRKADTKEQKSGTKAEAQKSQDKATKGEATGQAGTGSDSKSDQKAGRTGEGPASGTTGQTGAPRGTNGTATTGTAGGEAGADVQVSSEQQDRIRERLGRVAERRRSDANFNVAIGVAVPQTVTLDMLPPDVVEVVPRFRGYRYVVVEDRIVIVDPERRTVVYVIDRGGGRATTGSAAGAAGSVRITLTTEERDRLVRVVERRAQRLDRVEIKVGSKLPQSVELRSFEERVVRDIPKLQPYRYVVAEDEIVIVEPQDRTIVAVVSC